MNSLVRSDCNTKLTETQFALFAIQHEWLILMELFSTQHWSLKEILVVLGVEFFESLDSVLGFKHSMSFQARTAVDFTAFKTEGAVSRFLLAVATRDILVSTCFDGEQLYKAVV